MHKSKSSNIPTVFTILGVTGDLASKKIIPSLWHLFGHGLLPENLAVIGFARRPLSDIDFEKLVRDAVTLNSEKRIKDEDFNKFYKYFSYHSGTFQDEGAFISLAAKIDQQGESWGLCPNKIFYLATPPSAFEQIFSNLAKAKLNLPCDGDLGFTRILIEKPFGLNLSSAQELQKLLAKYFTEDQVYRIDHYFFKEIIQGIENFRFSNNLFEHAWDNTTIERIEIRLLESIGAEKRGDFYDPIGALRDVGQNHLLAMLSAIAMEYPKELKADLIQENRSAIISKLAPWTEESLKNKVFRAQHENYRDIKGVNPNSETETYFALETELDHPKWKGVPVFMEAGKRMAEARKEIILTLKHPKECSLCQAGPHEQNKIVFRLEPNDEIMIHFWAKKPGFERQIEERVFSFFLYEKETKVQYVEEYSKIIYAVMKGDQTLFSSAREIEASWKFIDPIINSWQSSSVPLNIYPPGSTPNSKLNKNLLDQSGTKPALKGELGLIGLGKMGANLARQLSSKNWRVVVANRSPDPVNKLQSEGLEGAFSMQELITKLPAPRTIWLMVPHQSVDTVLSEVVPLLSKGDTVIDGGNSPYKESIRRAGELSIKGLNFLDVGVSGGPRGALEGACVMVGGSRDLFDQYEPLFKDMSVSGGYGYMGKAGAGHFVKMVHNGIEYGMMQAIGEGFEVMKKSEFSLDLHSVSRLYNHNSVITSRLVGWLVNAYLKYGDDLKGISGKVSHSGEGQWTVEAAKELGVPVPIIEGALDFRKQSDENPSYTGQVVSALRNEFGGHDVSEK